MTNKRIWLGAAALLVSGSVLAQALPPIPRIPTPSAATPVPTVAPTPGPELDPWEQFMARYYDVVKVEKRWVIRHPDGTVWPHQFIKSYMEVGADAAGRRFARREIGQPEIHAAAGQAHLAGAQFTAPLADARGRLCRRDVGRVAEEQQVGARDHGLALPPSNSLNQNRILVSTGNSNAHADIDIRARRRAYRSACRHVRTRGRRHDDADRQRLDRRRNRRAGTRGCGARRR